MTTEVFAYLVAAYLLFTNVPVLVSKLLTVVFCVMTKHDNGPSMAVWDVSLYTGYNTTAKENEIMLRNLINQIDKMSVGSTEPIQVPMAQVPFTIVQGKNKLFLQSVSKFEQDRHRSSQRHSLMVGKSFSMANPVFDPLVSLVLLIRVDNQVHGYHTLRLLQATNANDTHQSLVDVIEVYPSLVGPVRHVMCVAFHDTGASKCGSIVLPTAVAASFVVDTQKTIKEPTALPSCSKYYCASDPTSIEDLFAFENWVVVSQIPNVVNQFIYATVNFAPTGFRLPITDAGFLDMTPDATAVMLPLVEVTTRRWMGSLSRIDFILQTQLVFPVGSHVATMVFHFVLLAKFSWTHDRNFLLLLVDNFTFEITNKSSIDTTVGLTLAITYWTYRDIILTMIVRQCLAPLPWNSSSLHSYMDYLIFIPGPVYYIFIFGLCAIKYVLQSCRVNVRLADVTLYLASIILLAGAFSHQGPDLTSQTSVEPNAWKPTLVAPMLFYVYRTSPHLTSYIVMAYATLGAIVVLPLIPMLCSTCTKRPRSRPVGIRATQTTQVIDYSSLDVAVGITIRFPGGFTDINRMYTQQWRSSHPRPTLYSLALSGYVQCDGCLMLISSAHRCVAAYILGSIVDTSGPIHYFKLTKDELQSKFAFIPLFQLNLFKTGLLGDLSLPFLFVNLIEETTDHPSICRLMWFPRVYLRTVSADDQNTNRASSTIRS
ncbi:hypothetical protein AeMF1_012934 [Aphanomyces euteiches]|nr:hypothetical protein AeMF1_012934 [Aphanomyces euteiches]